METDNVQSLQAQKSINCNFSQVVKNTQYCHATVENYFTQVARNYGPHKTPEKKSYSYHIPLAESSENVKQLPCLDT
jgi:hypothetical protein